MGQCAAIMTILRPYAIRMMYGLWWTAYQLSRAFRAFPRRTQPMTNWVVGAHKDGPGVADHPRHDDTGV